MPVLAQLVGKKAHHHSSTGSADVTTPPVRSRSLPDPVIGQWQLSSG